jgi:hypothetical protein
VSKWIKIVGILAVAAVAVAVMAAVVMAQGPNDADQDGVCDVCGERVGGGLMRGWRFTPDGEQAGQGQPENIGTCTCGDPTNGQGMMRGGRFARNADGTGQGWVDEDGDGLCDNCGSATCPYAQDGTRGRMGRWQSQ